MTKEQANEIRRIVDAEGWKAVYEHPVYGPLVEKEKEEGRRYVDAVIDRD